MDERKQKKITAAFINLGCKVNRYETDSMKQKLKGAGIDILEPDDMADFYIVNTCSVTNIAEKKSRQMLRRVKRKNPSAFVVAAGCYVNADHDGLSKAPYVDLVVGNNCKKDIVDILMPYINKLSSEQTAIDNNRTGGVANDNLDDSYTDMAKVSEFEEMGSLESTYLDHRRAYIKIQDGCNQFCSYCIIPYTRGRVRSRRPEMILEEISGLAKTGVKEFVLTGIHISSYGVDFTEETNKPDLSDLICQIAKIPEVMRIRVSSLEPRIITEEFVKKISKEDKLCPHFHLSLQSACNDTLKRMNRKYTIEEFKDKCRLLRKYYDRPAITTDVIVGFPGESRQEFLTTYNNLKELKLYEIHVFKYSVRKGTVAEKLPDQVSENEKNIRSDKLLELTSLQKKEFEESLLGLTDEVLIEEVLKEEALKDEDFSNETADKNCKKYTGYTKRYVRVYVESDADLVNEIITYIF